MIKEFQTSNVIEIMAVLLHGTERVMVVLVYRPPGVIGDFVNTLIAELRLLPTSSYRTLVIGDFNMDQRLPGSENTFKLLIEEFNFTQRSQFCTHIYGGSLDLVFDNNSNSKKCSGFQHQPIPYFLVQHISDFHFS